MKPLLFALFTVYTSCLVPDPKTPLIVRVEQAGSGDLRSASTNSILIWMATHPLVATDLAPQCVALMKSPPSAHWLQTTEGRTCRAVIHGAELAILRNHPRVQAVN